MSSRPYFASKNADLRTLAAAGNAQAQHELDFRKAKQMKLSQEGKLGQLRAAALGEGIKPTRQPKPAPAPVAAPVFAKAEVTDVKPAKAGRLTLKKLDHRISAIEIVLGIKRV